MNVKNTSAFNNARNGQKSVEGCCFTVISCNWLSLRFFQIFVPKFLMDKEVLANFDS